MKNKIYLLLLLLIPTFFLLTACNKQKTTGTNKTIIELHDKKLNYKTTFTVENGEKYSDVVIDETGGASAVLTFRNETLDVEFEMYYNKLLKQTYDSTKKGRSSQKYYKEYKFGECEAYAYGNYDDKIYLNIILDKENDDRLITLFVSIERIDTDKNVIISSLLKEKDLQNLFNSIKFEKLSSK